MSKSNPVHLWRFGRTRALILTICHMENLSHDNLSCGEIYPYDFSPRAPPVVPVSHGPWQTWGMGMMSGVWYVYGGVWRRLGGIWGISRWHLSRSGCLRVSGGMTRSLFQLARISFFQSRDENENLLLSISGLETRTRIKIKTILARMFENTICCLFLDW